MAKGKKRYDFTRNRLGLRLRVMGGISAFAGAVYVVCAVLLTSIESSASDHTRLIGAGGIAAVGELGGEFEGETADAAKSYWGQVHGCMASAFGAALIQLATSYSEYFNELDGIDGDAYARFVQEEIESAQRKASDTIPILADVDGGVRAALVSVSDIVSVAAPEVSGSMDGLSRIEKETGDLSQQVSAASPTGWRRPPPQPGSSRAPRPSSRRSRPAAPAAA